MPTAVAEAADAALASALAHLGVEEEIRQSTEPVPALEAEHLAPEAEVDMVGMANVACTHIPSVVTFGGQPVAADGDLIYLGGGLYASAAPAPKEAPAPAKGKPRLLPGRVRAGPRAAVGGQRSGRSASASARGSQSGGDIGLSPPISRAHSDGPPAPLLPDAASEKGGGGGPRAWRPAGAAKLPQPPSVEVTGRSARAAPLEDICEGGGHSEARAIERDHARREGGGLFGPRGLLGELAKMQEMPVAPKGGLTGAPHNSDARAMERRMAKEARVEQALADRAERLAAEAELKLKPKLLCRGTPGSSSAPALPLLPRPTPETPSTASQEDLERQKLRVACKMEMLDFFNGYASNIGRMNVDQTKALLAKLHGDLDVANTAYPVGRSGPPSSGRPSPSAGQHSPDGAAMFAPPPGNEGAGEEDGRAGAAPFLGWPAEGDEFSVRDRLQQINDDCNKAFDTCLLEVEGF